MTAFSEILWRIRCNDPCLTDIHLGGCGIDDEDVEALANVLRYNSHVKRLDLSMNYRISTVSPLINVLLTNTGITHLDFGGIHKFGVAGTKDLSKALAVSTKITHLRLVWNNLGEDGATSLADALRSNISIVSLNLRGTKIGSEGVKAIAKVLEGNSSCIESLDLSENIIGNEGTEYMAEAICQNSVLRSLDLSACFINSGGARSLARALQSNATVLKYLDLRYNHIKTDGAALLVRALEKNESIAHLDLRHNEIVGCAIACVTANSICRNRSRTIQLFMRYTARFGLRRYTTGTSSDRDDLLSGLTGVFLEGSGKKWLCLLQDACQKNGMLQLQTDFSSLEASIIPSAIWRIKSLLGLGGAFELVRSRPEIFGHAKHIMFVEL